MAAKKSSAQWGELLAILLCVVVGVLANMGTGVKGLPLILFNILLSFAAALLVGK